jgi:hypothetical protein
MTAAKRIILCLWLLLIGMAHASAAVTHDASENRVWENLPPILETCLADNSQVPRTQQKNDVTASELASGYSLAAESRPALARTLGQAGEDAVGITGPKVSIEIPGSGQIRIPDALSPTTLTEVKNVGSLSYTQQLRDFTTYSQANGLGFELYVRPSTQLSGPLQQAVANGQITLRFIPGAP